PARCWSAASTTPGRRPARWPPTPGCRCGWPWPRPGWSRAGSTRPSRRCRGWRGTSPREATPARRSPGRSRPASATRTARGPRGRGGGGVAGAAGGWRRGGFRQAARDALLNQAQVLVGFNQTAAAEEVLAEAQALTRPDEGPANTRLEWLTRLAAARRGPAA